MELEKMELDLKREISRKVIPFVETIEVQAFHQPVYIKRTSLLAVIGVPDLNDKYQRLTQAVKKPFRELVSEQLEVLMQGRGYAREWIGGNSGYVYKRWIEQKFLPM